MTQSQEGKLLETEALDCAAEASAAAIPPPVGSTLIEFPGARQLPAWRKELSERVREIQQKRAKEAALEAEEAARQSGAEVSSEACGQTQDETNASRLGLVPPPPEAPELNPIVAAALKRLERARQPVAQAADAPTGRRAYAAAAPSVVKDLHESKSQTQRNQTQPASRAEALVSNESKPATDQARVSQQRGSQRKSELQTQDEIARDSKVADSDIENGSEDKRAQERRRAESAGKSQGKAPRDSEKVESVESSAEKLVALAVKAASHAETLLDVDSRTDAKKTHAKELEASAGARAKDRSQATGEYAHVAARDSQKDSEVCEDGARATAKPQPRRVADKPIDDEWLSRLEERILPPVAKPTRSPEDVAPLASRIMSGLLDLLIVAFLSSPFAAIIELTNGNWTDVRVAASMGGIIITVMFLYLTISTALAGRTVAMSLFKLCTVDARTALAPTFGQCVRRTTVYILSLATLGIGFILALFDDERRAAHDRLSGTVVVR